jgi:4-hydroxy-4-methyl-2-oxoglutarate aldolase
LNQHRISAEVLDTLHKFDSPTISNVIELFEIRPRNAGYMDPTIRALFPDMPPIVGFASTATSRASRAASGRTKANLKEQIEGLERVPSPRIMVFEDVDSPVAAAMFGEVMCSVYQRFGCVGLITNGAGRDLDAIRRLGFAAFTSSVCVSHGYSHFEELNVPVQVGGIVVRPGDLIHADGNGIVVIPLDIAEKVAHACAAYIKTETVILDYLKNKDVDVGGLQGAFDKHVALMKAISKKFHGSRQRATSLEQGLV